MKFLSVRKAYEFIGKHYYIAKCLKNHKIYKSNVNIWKNIIWKL